jgi:hypothetical protein
MQPISSLVLMKASAGMPISTSFRFDYEDSLSFDDLLFHSLQNRKQKLGPTKRYKLLTRT